MRSALSPATNLLHFLMRLGWPRGFKIIQLNDISLTSNQSTNVMQNSIAQHILCTRATLLCIQIFIFYLLSSLQDPIPSGCCHFISSLSISHIPYSNIVPVTSVTRRQSHRAGISCSSSKSYRPRVGKVSKNFKSCRDGFSPYGIPPISRGGGASPAHLIT